MRALTMRTAHTTTEIKNVRIPGLGTLVRVSKRIEGGSEVVEYRRPTTKQRADTASRYAPSKPLCSEADLGAMGGPSGDQPITLRWVRHTGSPLKTR